VNTCFEEGKVSVYELREKKNTADVLFVKNP